MNSEQGTVNDEGGGGRGRGNHERHEKHERRREKLVVGGGSKWK